MKPLPYDPLPALPPQIEEALNLDGAIRLINGRYSEGYVDLTQLEAAVENGDVMTEKRQGMTFVVRWPKFTTAQLRERVLSHVRKMGGVNAHTSGVSGWDLCVDTIFNTLLFVRVPDTEFPIYVQMKFQNALIKVTDEIPSVHAFVPSTGRWDVVSGSWGVKDTKRPLSKTDEDAVNHAIFNEFRLRFDAVVKRAPRVIRDREAPKPRTIRER